MELAATIEYPRDVKLFMDGDVPEGLSVRVTEGSLIGGDVLWNGERIGSLADMPDVDLTHVWEAGQESGGPKDTVVHGTTLRVMLDLDALAAI